MHLSVGHFHKITNMNSKVFKLRGPLKNSELDGNFRIP